jgi:hypothetical protein
VLTLARNKATRKDHLDPPLLAQFGTISAQLLAQKRHQGSAWRDTELNVLGCFAPSSLSLQKHLRSGSGAVDGNEDALEMIIKLIHQLIHFLSNSSYELSWCLGPPRRSMQEAV